LHNNFIILIYCYDTESTHYLKNDERKIKIKTGESGYIATDMTSSFTPVGKSPVSIGGGSVGGTTNKTMPPKRTTASELLDQIRQLEIEGNKLRSSNLTTLGKPYFMIGLALYLQVRQV